MSSREKAITDEGLRRAYESEWWIFGATAASLLTLVFYPLLLRERTEGYLHPHGYCYLWDTALVSSHVASDLLIGIAYVAISVTLGYLVYRVRHLLPFHWMFLAFGLFILTCGATHFMDVWTLWFADFWASAALKIVTAVASVATALALPPLIPQIVRLLHAANVSEQRGELLETERRERADAEAQNQAKDVFLATLSHELRTPLNAVAGWTQVLQTPGNEGMRQKALDAIQRNVALQTRLVEDMLDMSTILSGRMRLDLAEVDLTALVRQGAEAMRSAAIDKSLDLQVHLPAERITVRADELRVQQILNNLLSNAVKFTPPKGRIDVTVACDGDAAVLTVADTGVGIAPLVLPRIFEVFVQGDQTTTRRAGGLGLGLAIVRHLVEQHGGSVSAESAGTGKGTRVSVRLPIGTGATAPEGRGASV